MNAFTPHPSPAPSPASPGGGPFAPVHPPQPTPPPLRKASNQRDLVAALILVMLSVITANFALYGHFHTGYALGHLAILLCGGIYLRPRLRRCSPFAGVCFALTLGVLGIYVWHGDSVFRAMGVCGTLLLTMLALTEATAGNHAPARLADVWRMLLSRPFAHMGTAVGSLFLISKGETIQRRRWGGILLGVVCAIPVLLVVVPLLVSADAAFEGLLRHTLWDNPAQIVSSLIVGLLLFLLTFSRWFSLRHRLPDPSRPTPSERTGVPAMGINAFLATIGFVYGVYLLSQLAYFFSAFSGILPAGYTVAQYARRGFFEMAVICTINLVLVAIALLLSRRQEGQAPRSTRWISLSFLLFSLGLVAISLSKMVLYIRSFGMTRLRMLTALFMLMLAAVLIFVAIRLFRQHFPYMRAAVITIALLGLIAGYADVDTVIARYNVGAYQAGHLEELDLDTLGGLSDGAVPVLIALWEERTPANQEQLADVLYRKMLTLGEVDEETNAFTPHPLDVRGYYIDTAYARHLLEQQAPSILAVRNHYKELHYESW